jgi:UTP--glucose-1-phosphate uridylyltransferase
VAATLKVRGAEIASYGVMKVEPVEGQWLYRVRGLVEKPAPRQAPSPWVVVGRYVLEPEIFDILAETPAGRGGEIQLTDALARYAAEKPMYAVAFRGERFDAGNRAGLLRATLHFAGKNRELSRVLRAYLKTSKQ